MLAPRTICLKLSRISEPNLNMRLPESYWRQIRYTYTALYDPQLPYRFHTYS